MQECKSFNCSGVIDVFFKIQGPNGYLSQNIEIKRAFILKIKYAFILKFFITFILISFQFINIIKDWNKYKIKNKKDIF